MTKKVRSRSLLYYHLKGWGILLLLSIGFAFSVNHFSEQALASSIKKSLINQADLFQQQLKDRLAQEAKWMEMLSADARFRDFARQLLMGHQEHGLFTGQYEDLAHHFFEGNRLLFQNNEVDHLLLLTDTGELRYSLGGHADELGENLGRDGFYGATVLSDLVDQVVHERRFSVSRFGKIEQFERNVTLMGLPLYLDDSPESVQPDGVMVALFPLDWVRKTLSRYETDAIYGGLGESGEISIIQWRKGEEGAAINFVNDFRTDELREPSQACQQMRMEQHDKFPMVKVLSRQNGAGWSLNPSCTPVYSVWRWLPELQWGMLLNQHREEVLRPLSGLREVTILLLLLYLPLFGLLVRSQLRELTEPIGELVVAAERGSISDFPSVEVHEVSQLATALQENEQRLMQANQAKDNFLASMSHELRTPLTAIIGNSELLADQERDDEKRQLVQSIMLAGRSQLALVNDILDMSKIDAGKFTIDQVPYSLSALFKDISNIFTARAEDADLTFVLQQNNREEYLLIGDSQRISQILINLLGNAIKFTEEGGVSMTTDVEGDRLIFTVKDTGIGIPPAVAKRLFTRFEQAESSISRRFGGSGLGLYISQSLAELMGGSISVTSEEDIGSTFTLSLPYQRSSQREQVAEDRGSEVPVLEERLSGHVLIAEDTHALQLLEQRILQALGLTTAVANNGNEVIDLVAAHPFDLILMDMQMPEMDGIEATTRLRKMGVKTPIIALTANVMQKHREHFDKAGCDDFLAKPIDREELGKVLKKYLPVE